MSSIFFERRDQVAIISLNRPEKHNALSREMILALSEIFTNFESQPDLRAVIITGVGDRSFCAGTDITELAILDKDRAHDVSERG